eukprot:499433-Prymnesium_polylepis.2
MASAAAACNPAAGHGLRSTTCALSHPRPPRVPAVIQRERLSRSIRSTAAVREWLSVAAFRCK